MSTEVTQLPVRGNTGIRLYMTAETEIVAKMDENNRKIAELTRQANQLAEAKLQADREQAHLQTQLNAARLARRHIEDSTQR